MPSLVTNTAIHSYTKGIVFSDGSLTDLPTMWMYGHRVFPLQAERPVAEGGLERSE